MATKQKVSLRDIAEKSGVTRMAVSLALRGKPGVSAATRKKVQAAADALGYRPDPEVAKYMAHIRSRSPAQAQACLALLTSGPSEGFWRRFRTERRYVEGAMARAEQYGYRLEEFWMNKPGLSPTRLESILWNRGVEGLLVAPLQARLSRKGARTIEMDFSRFVAVEISETIDSPDLDRAVHDPYTSMHKLLDEVAALGYARPGLVLEDALDLRVNGKWTAAYLQRSLQEGRKLAPLILARPDLAAFNRWFDKHKPDVVISVDRFGLQMLRERGVRIPQDAGYCSLDVDGEHREFPDVSGIDQNSVRIGAAAVDLVVAAVQRGHRGVPDHPVRMQVEGTWVAGRSTAGPGKRRAGPGKRLPAAARRL